MLLFHGPRTGGMMPDDGRAVLLALRFSRRLLVLMTNLTKSVLPSRVLDESLAGCGKICCLPRAENCPTINAVLSRVLNALFELDYHMPNAAETVEAPYTAAERLTFLPQPVRIPADELSVRSCIEPHRGGISGGKSMSAEFRQRHMRVIELNENDVVSQIRMNHGRELEVVDVALDQILQGLDAFAYVKQRPDSRLEDSRLENAQMFLAVRSFNSLHIARQLLERGYYQQASALVRMAMEDQLVAEDAETHPPTLDALLDDKGSISSGDLTYGKMAERISPEAQKAWDEKYGDLSERAAHPRRLSLLALTTVRRTVRPGGHYDEVQVKVTFLYLLEQLGQVLRTVGLLTANVESPWAEGARPALRDMTALYREIVVSLGIDITSVGENEC